MKQARGPFIMDPIIFARLALSSYYFTLFISENKIYDA